MFVVSPQATVIGKLASPYNSGNLGSLRSDDTLIAHFTLTFQPTYVKKLPKPNRSMINYSQPWYKLGIRLD